jgi:hypothetical protein
VPTAQQVKAKEDARMARRQAKALIGEVESEVRSKK